MNTIDPKHAYRTRREKKRRESVSHLRWCELPFHACNGNINFL